MTATALGPLLGITAGSFLATNVDNLVLTTAQLAAARAEKTRAIVRGQVGGALLVIAGAVVFGTAVLALPARMVGLLGLVPITLGLRQLWAWRRDRVAPTAGAIGHVERWPVAGGFVLSALITVAASADNLSVYVPLFRQVTLLDAGAVIGLLVAMDLGLCALAVAAGRHPGAVALIERAGTVVRPLLYLVIGVVILTRAGTLTGW